MAMLEYENQLFLDMVDGSNLFIFAKGISTRKVMENLFRLYSTDENLVFVLLSSPSEEMYFLDKLKPETSRIFSVTTEYSAADRKNMYRNGGLFFITSRILVVDFLKDNVPTDKITGIVLFRAHNVIETSQESFILRLYRTKNKTGWIKCFSHSPTSFLMGFNYLNRVMRSCFLANLSLWPRFHSAIKESLSQATDSDCVIEIQLKLTEEMRIIQTNFLDLVSWTISELKRLIPELNDDDISPEISLSKNFDKLIRSRIDPIWNTLSTKSKELLNDLKIFRLLLQQLTKADCISFYSSLSNYTTIEASMKSSWIVSDAAEKIITAARARLKPPKSKGSGSATTASTTSNFNPEIHPKWSALLEILNEVNSKINETLSNSDDSELQPNISINKTLIFTEDVKSAIIIRDLLSLGTQLTLAKIARNTPESKLEVPNNLIDRLNSINRKNRDILDKNKVGGLGKNFRSRDEDDKGQPNESIGPTVTEVQITLTQIQRKYDEIQFLQSPVFVRPLKTFGEEATAYAIPELLENLRPDVIIIFDPELELIRNIETYRARVGPSQKVTVYFLIFRNSIEEQMYLTGIQREKQAFEKLIEEKANMVVPNEREGLDELNQDLWRDPKKANETISVGITRRNQDDGESERQLILVDMREFRSELPSLIHKRGIELEPLTLDVGDYILNPDICVERKSISDLIGSLNSGRLYKQAEAMGRHYKKPVLLIEHEQKTTSYRYKNDISQVMPKLQLLTLNFPNLRIIWSPGAHYTAEVFHELKRGKPQPCPTMALSILKEASGTEGTTTFSPASHSFLSKLPGIDSRNIYRVLSRAYSLDVLCQMSQEELEKVLENSAASKDLYNGLHNNLVQVQQKGDEQQQGGGAGTSSKIRGGKMARGAGKANVKKVRK